VAWAASPVGRLGSEVVIGWLRCAILATNTVPAKHLQAFRDHSVLVLHVCHELWLLSCLLAVC